MGLRGSAPRQTMGKKNSPLGRDIWLVRNANNEHSKPLQEAEQICFDCRRKPVQSWLKGSNRKQTFGRPFLWLGFARLHGSRLHQQKAMNSGQGIGPRKGKASNGKKEKPILGVADHSRFWDALAGWLENGYSNYSFFPMAPVMFSCEN